jgi:serine/threonine protein kinase
MTETAGERLASALADRYRVENEIGRGSSATVYLAHDLRHGRKVALKVLHSALGAALGVERFLREIRTAARYTKASSAGPSARAVRTIRATTGHCRSSPKPGTAG